MRTYRARVLDQVLEQRLRSAGAVLLEGPKACGKTFTAEQVTASQVYLDTDYAALAAIRIDPGLVLNGSAPQLIDEWQLEATRVWNHVRSEVNRRGSPGQFVLTGSAMPEDDARRHTGAGRFARLVMRPMSLYESGHSTGTISLAGLLAGERHTAAEATLGLAEVAELVVRGGWPLNLDLPIDAAAQANADYLRTIAEVDIARLDGVRRNPALVQRVLQSLARNVATEQKVARLAADVEGGEGTIARSTVYALLDALRRLMVLEEQPPWTTHLRSRAVLRTAPCTHLIDPSLAAAALAAGPQRLLADLNYFGLLFESLVVRDVRIYSTPLDAAVQHYRDSDGLEVDVIVQARDGRWGAFEVKLGGEQNVEEAVAGLLKFAAKVDTTKVGQPAVLGVVTASGYGYTRPDGVVIIPIGALGP